LTSNAHLLPVAAECLDSCSEETGCTMPMLGRLLNASGACPQGAPPVILMSLVDLPWGPLITYGLGLLSLLTNPGFNFGKGATWADHYPLPEYLGAWLQSFILLQADYSVLKHVGSAADQGAACQFLLFNTMAITSSAAVALAPISAIFSAYRKGYGPRDSDASSFAPVVTKARAVGLLALAFPLIVAYLSIMLMAVGAISLFVTAIPAAFAFLHISIISIILFMIVFFVGRCLFSNEEDQFQKDFEVLNVLMAQSCDRDILMFISLLQLLQGVGILAWAWYLPGGPNYTSIHDMYFEAFELPPFNWNFDFGFYFSADLWSRLFSFDLGEYELFGTSVAVQLIFLALSLIRRGFACCLAVRSEVKSDSNSSGGNSSSTEVSTTKNPTWEMDYCGGPRW
jgi:hypothetical protein